MTNLAMTNLERAALNWWKERRPLEWTHLQHLVEPTVNTAGPKERALAKAVAEWIRLRPVNA